MGWVRLKEELVIAWHDKLPFVRQLAQPLIKVLDLSKRLREHREVASVYEDVAIGYFKLAMKSMSVADDANLHRFHEMLLNRTAFLWN